MRLPVYSTRMFTVYYDVCKVSIALKALNICSKQQQPPCRVKWWVVCPAMRTTSVERQIRKMTGLTLSSGRCLLYIWLACFGVLSGVLSSNSRTAAACDPLTSNCRVLTAYSVIKACIKASIATIVALVVLMAAVWTIDMVAWLWSLCPKSSPKQQLDQHCGLHHQSTTGKQQQQQQQQSQQSQHPTKDTASSSAACTQHDDQHSIVLPTEQYYTVLHTQQHSNPTLSDYSNVLHTQQHSCVPPVKQYSNTLPREQYCSCRHMSKAPLPAAHDVAVDSPAGPLHLDSNLNSKQRHMDDGCWLVRATVWDGTKQMVRICQLLHNPGLARSSGSMPRLSATFVQIVLGWIGVAALCGVCTPAYHHM